MNEVFQWGALAGVLLLVLAVYRQFGLMLTSSPEKRAYAFGPLVGRPAGERLMQLFPSGRPDQSKLLVFVRENCSSCEDLMAQIADWRSDPTNQPFELGIVVDGAESFVTQTRGSLPDANVVLADQFLDEGHKLNGKPLLAFPFSILLSGQGVVREKQVGSDGTALLTLLRGEPLRAPAESTTG